MRPMRRRRAVQNNEVLGRKPAGAGAADTGPEALFSLVRDVPPGPKRGGDLAASR